MPERTCPACGQPMQGDVCVRCRAATTIAKPEHAERAKVTPPASSDGAIRAREPPQFPALSIRKEVPHVIVRWLPHIVVGVILTTCVALLFPAVEKVREASHRTQTINNFKSISLSLHNYHDQMKALPTPTRIDRDKREVQLSWRFSILPFIESSPLYSQMDSKVGWDHPNNAAFQHLHLAYYTCPHRDMPDQDGHTHFQYFIGPGTLFPANVPVTYGDIKDGTSTTFLFAEADQAVLWLRPADMDIRADQPLPLPHDYFVAAMADASVREVMREKTSDAILRQLINPNDQKPGAGWDK
jgi:hypothetical protein